jgi:hypothetical protein
MYWLTDRRVHVSVQSRLPVNESTSYVDMRSRRSKASRLLLLSGAIFSSQKRARLKNSRCWSSLISVARKQLTYWGAKARQGQALNQRPDINTLSDCGLLPGKEGGVYMARGGVVRVGENGPVCGTWFAQPITTSPASYRCGN